MSIIHKRKLQQVPFLILIMLLLYNSAGCFLVFKLAQTSIQRNMDEQAAALLSNERLKTFSFKMGEEKKINWLRKGKEFSFNGKHYDVVRSEKTEEQITYFCLADDEEDHLFSDFEQHFGLRDTPMAKNKPAEKVATPFYPSYFIHKKMPVFYVHIISILSIPPIFHHYPLVYLEVKHPPPSFM